MSPESAIMAVARLLEAAGRGSSIPEPSVLVGHSFGALIGSCATRLAKDCTIRRALLLAPVLSYRESPDSGTREDLLEHLASVRESRPYTYRLAAESEWQVLARGITPFEEATATWQGPVLSIVGDADDTFDINVLQRTHQSLVTEVLGPRNTTLKVVGGAGHGMDELLSDAAAAERFLISGTPD